ncbi:universal stress protein [Terrabacter sp. MAHUQ-38]|uniref:universal stress protein n=1 Tax=unclassified Terrabacter TaxID=2630222 RepID=UPI00165EA58C|nr:universal stress protein [Terrabacter sp. MAHUQ-38]
MRPRDTATRIVAGVDGSQASVHALRWAWRQAQSTGATLSAVIAWDQPAHDAEAAYAGVGPLVDWEGAARLHVEDSIRETVGEDGLPGVTPVVTWGRPAAVLMEAAADADLLVVGTHGHQGLLGTLSGSVSLHLAHHAPCPLTIIPSPRDARPPTSRVSKIVVGVDGSPPSLQALQWASRQAKATLARLEAVMVYASPNQPISPTGAPGGNPYGWRGNADLKLHHAVVDALGYQAAKEVTQTVLEGHALPALIAVATDADMLVVGSSGHGALAGMLLGSVSTRLSEHPPCPLTIIRPSTSTSHRTRPHANWRRRTRSDASSAVEHGHFWRP